MKISCLSLGLLSTMCWLYLTPTTGNKIFQFGPCMISMNVNEIRASFTAIKATIQAKDAVRTISILKDIISLKSADRCCIIHHLLRFYVDKVFKHCETEDSHVNRKISSIANSFLFIKKKFRQCTWVPFCSFQIAIIIYQIFLSIYFQLNTASAAMKSLGELDILLDWMEKAH
uniref:Interleukin family protein n=1 Tax=Terrapene triunguis TaxID=2587831 RepID=A0A674IK67_9SAUR